MTNLQRRLLLVEDEMLMSALLADSLKNANFAVETAADAAAARKAIKTFDPDIMLIDIFLGSGPNGIQLANAVSQTNPEIGLLILTKYQDSLSSANDLGQLPENCGFLRKDMVSDTSYLVSAIEAVLSDRAAEVRQDMAIGKSVADLNEKQTQILRLLAEGFTNAEIASRTELSVKSVERYLAQIFDHLEIRGEDGVNQRVEAARRYYLAAGIPERS
jgi:DNA-binding NarL/FixJ family response regulator